MIDQILLIEALCKSYPGFRDRLVQNADDWLSLNGKILWSAVVGCLSNYLQENIEKGMFDDVDKLFNCIEKLIVDGNDEVADLMTTEFLEGLLNSPKLDRELWKPFIGPKCAEYCDKVDDFYGTP